MKLFDPVELFGVPVYIVKISVKDRGTYTSAYDLIAPRYLTSKGFIVPEKFYENFPQIPFAETQSQLLSDDRPDQRAEEHLAKHTINLEFLAEHSKYPNNLRLRDSLGASMPEDALKARDVSSEYSLPQNAVLKFSIEASVD